MKLCHLITLVAILWTSSGETKAIQASTNVASKRTKIVRKQQVPTHARKQYIDTYGGNSLITGGQYGGDVAQSDFPETANEIPAQENLGNTLQEGELSLNSGFSQTGMSNEFQTNSNDLVDSTESTDGRQMIGNDVIQGGELGASFSDGNAVGTDIDGGIGAGISTGLGGGGIEANGLNGGTGGGLADSLGGLGGGAGGGADGGADGGGGMQIGGGLGGGLSDGIGDNIDNVNLGFGGGGDGIGAGGGVSDGGDNDGGGGIDLGGSIGGGGFGGGSLGNTGIAGGSLGNSGGIEDGNFGGSIESGGISGNSINDLGGSLGDNLDGGTLNDGLPDLDGNYAGNMAGGIGLEALGSRIAAGSKVHHLGGLAGSVGGLHHFGQQGLGGASDVGMPGMLGGMSHDHQIPEDLQLSDATDENPSILHAGLASILPGKTVHAHVSDKPTGNRPAISAPSVNAALQVQMEAEKQHQKRLQALKIKLKNLRKKLESLQMTGNKQDTISNRRKQEKVDSEEINTLNELRMATQDAIKELHTDYPHTKKKPPAQPKHESLGAKLKTVDFTAKETGDTLEELLRLLDPELEDKKRGQVDGRRKTNNTRLDNEAESKLATLTKKAEDEVEKLANTKEQPVVQANVSDVIKVNKSKDVNTPSVWKGLIKYLEIDKSKAAPSKMEYKSLGCWRDDPNRIVPSLENTSPLLQDGYRIRRNSVRKCALVAKEQGFDAFAMQNGGQCFGGQFLLQRYRKFGRSRDCASDGRGGDYAMEVYSFLKQRK